MNDHIEFKVYFQRGVSTEDVLELGHSLADDIIDLVSDKYADLGQLTQDVTFEVHMEEDKLDDDRGKERSDHETS